MFGPLKFTGPNASFTRSFLFPPKKKIISYNGLIARPPRTAHNPQRYHLSHHTPHHCFLCRLAKHRITSIVYAQNVFYLILLKTAIFSKIAPSLVYSFKINESSISKEYTRSRRPSTARLLFEKRRMIDFESINWEVQDLGPDLEWDLEPDLG